MEGIESKIFQLSIQVEKDCDLEERRFFQIKKKTYDRGALKKNMLQFIDISSSILYDNQREHSNFLGLVNACVSHELRNPLNSIVAENTLKKKVIEQIYKDIEVISRDSYELYEKLKLSVNKIMKSVKVEESSTDLMGFLIQDLLDYAQIKAGKFRKNIKKFNIREAVQSVIDIQYRLANSRGLKLYSEFIDILEVCIIKSDEARIKQVLLGLQSNALKFTEEG